MSSYSADVVIVGGGLVGASTAYFLAGEGIDCVVVERDGIASHASGFSYAALGTFDEAGMDGAHFDVASLGMRLHHELAESLLDETGRERGAPREALAVTGLRRGGSRRRTVAGGRGARPALVGGGRAGVHRPVAHHGGGPAVEPRINPAVLGAVYTEGTCDVNAQRLTLALAMGAEQRGARIVRGPSRGCPGRAAGSVG